MSENLLLAFDKQRKACELFGSPLTAAVVQFFHDDFAAGGVIAELTRDWQGNPLDDNVPLRLAGFVHFNARQGNKEIAAFFETCGGRYNAAQKPLLFEVLKRLFLAHRDEAKKFLRRVPQTNEVGRAAVLLLGFSEIARRVKKPLILREIGASAGLNLCFDDFYYAIETPRGMLHWGDVGSPLTLTSKWRGSPPPPLIEKIEIYDRRGCDLSPVDLTDKMERQILKSWVWGDMGERQVRLQVAMKIAAKNPPTIDKADAADWVAEQLETHARGAATVFYHSIVWPYLSADCRRAIETQIVAAGEKATPQAPLAWLQLDSPTLSDIAALSYRLWDGDRQGEKVFLGPAHPHGADMEIVYSFDSGVSGA